MKRRAVDLLCCPMCLGDVALSAWREERDVEEGLLECVGCGRAFPIINGIPRMLPDALSHLTAEYHQDFFARYPQHAAVFKTSSLQPRREKWWRDEAQTIQSYSYQWRKFKQMFPQWQQVFLDSVKPITRDFFPGKVGLDGGCGFGRSLYYAASYGAEMIGLDLSEAIEAARENTASFDRVHLVQGDIFHPPVKRHSLDFVYSIGVLHHLPDPKSGFLRLTQLLKPGAPMFIWVYLRGRGRQIAGFTAMRAITTRMPLRLLNVVSFGLAAAQTLVWLAPYRALKRFRVTAGLADRIPFTLYARYPFRVLHTDWFDGLSVPLQNYYRRDDIAEWYRQAGHERVRIDDDWNGRALGYAPLPDLK